MFDQQSVGPSLGRDSCVLTQDTQPRLLRKVRKVVLSTLLARLPMNTQAYILMDCKRGNLVSAPGVCGNGLRKKNVAHTLKWPPGLVCQATCIKKKTEKTSFDIIM